MTLRCNIDGRGRLLRLVLGAVLATAAAWLALGPGGGWRLAATTLLGAAAAFVLFEAAAGWCAARACGLRTPF
jgi:hypothetical protein